MKFNESSIPTNYVQALKPKNMEWDPANTKKIYEIVFASMSDFLALVKSKEQKVAISFEDLKGNFKFAGIVAYHPNENKEIPGNYSFEISTDKSDLDGAKVFSIGDPQFARVASSTAHNLHGIKFNQQSFIIDLYEAAATTLLQWLDVNADAKEEKSIELDGYFVASVAVEDDKKIFAIVPDGAMKRLIKDDTSLESDVA